MPRPPVHGMTNTPIFKVWQAMHQRCYNPKDKRYNCYGGRGIRVEDTRWFTFINFFNDMGQRPDGTSIDRIDNNKGYYKENCRWANIFVQNVNRRNVVLLEYKGELKPMKYWGEQFNISIQLIRHRLKTGLSVTQSLETPVKIWKYQTP